MPALVSNPLLDPAAYDFIVVAGQSWPATPNQGVVRLTGSDRIYGWDVKDAPGSQGATLTYRGWKPSDGITLRFEFWEQAHITDWYSRILPLLEYDAGKASPKPVTVFHPVLAVQGITAIVIKQIGQLTGEDKQLWSVTVQAIEYRPAPKSNATSTPKSAKSTSPEKEAAEPEVKDKLDIKIEELRAKAHQPRPRRN